MLLSSRILEIGRDDEDELHDELSCCESNKARIIKSVSSAVEMSGFFCDGGTILCVSSAYSTSFSPAKLSDSSSFSSIEQTSSGGLFNLMLVSPASMLKMPQAPSNSEESEFELKLELVAKFGDEKEMASEFVVAVFDLMALIVGVVVPGDLLKFSLLRLRFRLASLLILLRSSVMIIEEAA